MTIEELEQKYIRSLDVSLTAAERHELTEELRRHPELGRKLALHKEIREKLARKQPATFGAYFASKLVHKIENTGVVIDRQIFTFFRKVQLAVLGVIVGLLILNIMFTSQMSLPSILGLDRTTTTTEDQSVPSFDFFENFNE